MKYKAYIFLICLLSLAKSFAAIVCTNPKEECIEPGGTRMFGANNDMPLTLPCWKYKVSYECKPDNGESCETLKNNGCSPVSTKCQTSWHGICAVQEMVYDCPTQKCTTSVSCEEATGFCLKGDCVSQVKTQDDGHKRALSALSAVAEASKDFSKNHDENIQTKLTIFFKGEKAECSKNIANFKDCCGSPKGWGEGVFDQCEEDEKALAKQKAAGLAVEVGTYCHNKVLGKCTSEHTTYCVYKSKLARIVRVAARDQLGRGFGTPENPSCTGISAEDFMKLKFENIDFSDFFNELNNKVKVKMADVVNPAMESKLGGVKESMENKANEARKKADEMLTKKKI